MVDIEKIINNNDSELEKEIKYEYDHRFDHDKDFGAGDLYQTSGEGFLDYEEYVKYKKLQKDSIKNGLTKEHINAMNKILRDSRRGMKYG